MKDRFMEEFEESCEDYGHAVSDLKNGLVCETPEGSVEIDEAENVATLEREEVRGKINAPSSAFVRMEGGKEQLVVRNNDGEYIMLKESEAPPWR